MVKDEITTLYNTRYLIQEKTQSGQTKKAGKSARDEISILLSQRYVIQEVQPSTKQQKQVR